MVGGIEVVRYTASTPPPISDFAADIRTLFSYTSSQPLPSLALARLEASFRFFLSVLPY